VRIAIVSTPFVAVPPRSYGGTELVIHELVRGLAARGHEVTLFATGDSRAPRLRYVFRRASWPPDPAKEARHCAGVARALARERFDVIHAHLPGLLAAGVDRIAPVVHTLHHDHQEPLTELYLRHPAVRYVAISEHQARLEPRLACHVVHHGLSPSHHPPGHGEGDYALFLGRLSPCKGPDAAVEAALGAGVPLRLAGSVHAADATPGWAASLERALARPGVLHVGPVGGARKTALLGAARALLMPIRWDEPFGLVMIEAMLSGTPVVAFPRGAAPEIIDEGVTGFLVDGVEEMSAVLARLGGFDRMACRRRAQARFGAARMIHEYERIYALAAAGARAVAGVAESSYAG
jgi:glycosyltransferase involved in cell wall biosynthesis